MYRYSAGDGGDAINNVSSDSAVDRLVFTNVVRTELSFARVGNNLVITRTAVPTDSIQVTNWFTATGNRIDFVDTSDGQSTTANEIDALIGGGGGSFPNAVLSPEISATEQLVGSPLLLDDLSRTSLGWRSEPKWRDLNHGFNGDGFEKGRIGLVPLPVAPIPSPTLDTAAETAYLARPQVLGSCGLNRTVGSVSKDENHRMDSPAVPAVPVVHRNPDLVNIGGLVRGSTLEEFKQTNEAEAQPTTSVALTESDHVIRVPFDWSDRRTPKDLLLAQLPVAPMNPVTVDQSSQQLERLVQAMASFSADQGFDQLSRAIADELASDGVQRLAVSAVAARMDVLSV